MACTEKDEIWKISESEKCVHRMEAWTAAVCEANGGGFKEKKQWEGRAIIGYVQIQPFNLEMISIATSKAEGSFARIRA
jgi:hypothetical protein